MAHFWHAEHKNPCQKPPTQKKRTFVRPAASVNEGSSRPSEPMQHLNCGASGVPSWTALSRRSSQFMIAVIAARKAAVRSTCSSSAASDDGTADIKPRSVLGCSSDPVILWTRRRLPPNQLLKACSTRVQNCDVECSMGSSLGTKSRLDRRPWPATLCLSCERNSGTVRPRQLSKPRTVSSIGHGEVEPSK